METIKEKVLELRKNGFTINEISKALGCSKSTISYHINNYGMGGSVKGFLYGISNDDIDKIKEYRKSLKTYDEIKSLTNISEDKLKKICRNLGLNKPNNNGNTNTIKIDDVIKVYEETKSLRKTAKHFNVDRATIRKMIPDNLVTNNVSNRIRISNAESVVLWRKRSKIKLVEYKGGKCEICGYNKSIRSLEFHHTEPDKKDFTISGKSYSFEKLKKEVDKCIMVCSNCHCEIHDSLEKNI